MKRPDDDALRQLAESIPRHRPWRKVIAVLGVGFALGIGLGAVASLGWKAVREPPEPAGATAPVPLDASASADPMALRTQLRNVDLSACAGLSGPSGPGNVDLYVDGEGRVQRASFAPLVDTPAGSPSPEYQGTRQGTCILHAFRGATLRRSSGGGLFTIAFALGPAEGR